MPRIKKGLQRLIIGRRLPVAWLMAVPVIALVAWGMSTDFGRGQNKAYAITQDAWVQIKVDAPGLSNVTLTSQNYSFGDCNSAPGQDFSAPVTCGGIQFGPPNGVLLEMAYVPSGYQSGQWSVVSNSTDGTVSCQSYGCMFNFYSGTAVVQLVVNPIPPATPSLSVSNPTTSSLQLNWTSSGPSGSGPVTYTIYHPNSSNLASTTATSYTLTGLSCGTSYSYYVIAQNQEGETAQSNTVTASTSSCPAPSPSPTPTPTGSGGGTPSKTTTSGSSTPSTITVNNSPAPAAPSVPATPTNLQATADQTNTSVQLSWSPGDNLNLPDAYELDRSSDNGKTWTTLTNTLSGNQTTYTDQTGKYNTAFTYRLAALDLTGLSSSYVTASVTTAQFTANIQPDSATTLSTPDKLFSLYFPAGAVGEPEFCSINKNTTPGLTPPTHYQLISPLYTISCTDSSGDTPPLLSDITITGNVGQYAKIGYIGQGNGAVSGLNGLPSARTVNFKLSRSYSSFALVGQPASMPWWLKVLLALIVIVPLAYLIRRYLRRGRIDKALEQVDAQYRKEWGL